MASPSAESFRPLDNLYNILPQGHEKALKHAFYNTAAILFVAFASAAAVAVFYILESFLRPLLWAVLVGSFLYPFKRSLTNVLRNWLNGLNSSGTPFVVGIALIPVKIVDRSSQTVGGSIARNFKLILVLISAILGIYILYYFGPLTSMFLGVQTFFLFLNEASSYFSSLWAPPLKSGGGTMANLVEFNQILHIWTVLISYLLVIIFLWTPENSSLIRYLSIPVWILLILHLSAITGPLRVPLLILILTSVVIGFITEKKKVTKVDDDSADGTATPEAEAKPPRPQWLRSWFCNERESEPGVSEADTQQPAAASEKKSEKPPPVAPKPSLSLPSESVKEPRSFSDLCFIALFWAYVLVTLWKNLWILPVFLPLPFAVMLVKGLFRQLGDGGLLGDRVRPIRDRMNNWIETRKDVLAPRPLRGLMKIFMRGDRQVITALGHSLDKATSVLLILVLLIGTVLIAIFSAVQVHRESMHLVAVSSTLFNDTLHPELTQWLPNSEDMHQTIDTMVNNAYVYGRGWITTKVREVVDGEKDGNSDVERQVLEFWDKLYEMYFSKNASSEPTTSLSKPGRSSGLDLKNISSIWEMVSSLDNFIIGDAIAFAKENVGTLMSVLDSVWLVLKGNLNLLMSVATSCTSVVLGGGTALLNFVLSAVIFLTTLFYLLASSGDQYKPFDLFSGINPTSQGGSRFGQAVEEAIGGVFMASLKMTAFYGLYTWLIHTVFGVNIVFIPAAVAAMFAAVPFLSTYLAAIPAVLELWLVHNDGVLALLLLICQMLPTYIVDTAIYSEIKGGHPFMTGLAIAGGMICLGLEGAIIGPILLCCLIVAVNVYTSMLKPDSAATTPSGVTPGSKVFSLSREGKRVHWNLPRSLSTDDHFHFTLPMNQR